MAEGSLPIDTRRIEFVVVAGENFEVSSSNPERRMWVALGRDASQPRPDNGYNWPPADAIEATQSNNLGEQEKRWRREAAGCLGE
jgi:hypothetical protein